MIRKRGVSADPSSRRRRRGRLTVQSKLLMMLLGVSILSTLVVGFVGYRSGTASLRQAAFDRMIAAREFRSGEITRLFTSVRRPRSAVSRPRRSRLPRR